MTTRGIERKVDKSSLFSSFNDQNIFELERDDLTTLTTIYDQITESFEKETENFDIDLLRMGAVLSKRTIKWIEDS